MLVKNEELAANLLFDRLANGDIEIYPQVIPKSQEAASEGKAVREARAARKETERTMTMTICLTEYDEI